MEKLLYQQILEITSDGFWALDKDRKTIDVNESLCNMIGYTREEMLGRTPFEFVDEENKNIFLKQTSQIESTKHRTYEIKLRKKNGTTLHTIFNATTLRDKNDSFLIAFAIVTDISESIALREQLLIERSKMATLGEMLASIVHQWKHPLGVLKLLTENLKYKVAQKEQSREELEEFAERLDRQLDYMTQTINDFKNFTKPCIEKKCFSVKNAIESALNLLESELLRYSVDIETTYDADEKLVIFGYESEFKQAIMNFIINAIESINAKESKPHTRGSVKIHAKSDNEHLCIDISDSGLGIDEESIGSIFDPSFTTKTTGSGIGLSICKLIISDRMRGTITAKNITGGALIEIRIPLCSNIKTET